MSKVKVACPQTGKKQADCLFRSARRHARAKRYAEAIADINQAIHLVPSTALYDYRGVLFSIVGETQEALVSFAQALSLTTSPQQEAEIYFHRSLLYGRERSYDLALMDLSRAQQLSPCKPEYREAKTEIEKECAVSNGCSAPLACKH